MNAFVVNECPICMDPIETQRNCVTTECGHCFHTNCLMTSVAHNGFNCPYCRTAMAEEPEDDESSIYETDDGEDEMFNDNALRGFRFFFKSKRNFSYKISSGLLVLSGLTSE